MEVPSGSNEKVHIISSKGMIICRCPYILTRTKIEEEGDAHHSDYYFVFLSGMTTIGRKEYMNHQCD